MTHRIRFTEEARDDLRRLYAFALESSEGDWRHPERIIDAIESAISLLANTPFAGRRVGEDAALRELLIGFGSAGFAALYEVEGDRLVTLLAFRHQREDHYR